MRLCRVDHEPFCAYSCSIDSSLPGQQERGECIVLETRHQVKMQDPSAMMTFPSIPMPTKEEWDHLQRLCPNILELCSVFASADVKTAWDLHIGDILGAAKDEGVPGAAAHVQIRALFNAKPTAKAPARRNISYIIILSKSLLDKIDPGRTMTAAECRAAGVSCIHESLQQPVDPRRLVSTKVCTTTMPLGVQPLTLRMAVVWPTPSSPPPGARFVLTAIVKAQRPPPAIGIDICIPARGLSCAPLYGETAIN